MSNTYYNGVPIESIDFDKELEKEIATLEENLKKVKEKKEKGKINAQYWTLKLQRANKALEVAKVVLD